jgi:hypothetical protein
MNSRALEKAFRRVRAAAKRRKLPDLEESTSYGTPALKVRNKLVIRIKDEDTVVIMCPLEEKEILMAGAPDIYFETAHYSGWPAILARLSQLKDEELQHRLEKAWRYRAPKRVVARFDRQGDTK